MLLAGQVRQLQHACAPGAAALTSGASSCSFQSNAQRPSFSSGTRADVSSRWTTKSKCLQPEEVQLVPLWLAHSWAPPLEHTGVWQRVL